MKVTGSNLGCYHWGCLYLLPRWDSSAGQCSLTRSTSDTKLLQSFCWKIL